MKFSGLKINLLEKTKSKATYRRLKIRFLLKLSPCGASFSTVSLVSRVGGGHVRIIKT